MTNLFFFFEGSSEVLTSTLTDLTLRSKDTSISMLLNSTAGKLLFNHLRNIPVKPWVGEYLKNRSYKGLEANIGQDDAAEVEEGRSGIARGYSNEKE